MSDIFDLDALVREANKEPFRFRFGGEDYELPPSIDVRAVTAMVSGRLEEGLRVMLGADQMARIEASNATLDVDTLKALFDRYTAHSGLDLGK